MDLFEVIKNRHSYRGTFAPTAVKRDDLTKIVEAALAAPSGKNAQTTEFIIIDAPELLGQIQQLHPGNKAMHTAKAYIACVIDRNPEAVYEGFAFQVEDCAAAVENMLLSITALGYASVWIDGWLRVNNNADAIGKLLGVPEDKVVRILLPIGVPAEKYQQPSKLPFDKRAFFNKYGK